MIADFMRILKFMKKKAVPYTLFMIIDQSLISICYNLVLAFILKDVTNAIAYQDIQLLKRAFMIAIVSFLIAFTIQPIVTRRMKYCIKSSMGELRLNSFRRMTGMKANIFEKQTAGDVMSRLQNDVDTVEEIYTYHIPSLFFALFHGIAAIVMMLNENVLLGVISVLMGILSVKVGSKVGEKVGSYSKTYQEELGSMSQEIIDIEEGFTEIKMNCAENYFMERVQKRNKKLSDSYYGRTMKMNQLAISSEIFGGLNSMVLMGLGFYLALKGNVSIGSILAIIHLNGNASYLFENFSNFIGGIKKNLPAGRRVIELLDFEVEEAGELEYNSELLLENASVIKDENTTIKLAEMELSEMELDDLESKNPYEFGVEQLSFGYPKENTEEDSKKILNNISFTLRQGEFSVLEGESGSGKSTLLKLLLGFYEGNSGDILLNGSGLKKLGKKALRDSISYIPQDCYLFHMSIIDNVRLGNQNASKEEVVNACKLAYAHDFIMELEDKYDTIVEVNGENLSGGQKQRIAMARAFLKKSNIIIMDESTSALDFETESMIKNSIDNLKKDKIILMISHRSSIITGADRILQLSEGTLI